MSEPRSTSAGFQFVAVLSAYTPCSEGVSRSRGSHNSAHPLVSNGRVRHPLDSKKLFVRVIDISHWEIFFHWFMLRTPCFSLRCARLHLWLRRVHNHRCHCTHVFSTLTNCNTAHHTATLITAMPLQHTGTHCNIWHCNTSHAATHCNTLQHTATHCNKL